MASIVTDYLLPLKHIAEQLKRLADLYEADLATRNIHPVTEEPREDDTEVWYGDGKTKKPRFGNPLDWFNQNPGDQE